MASIHDMYLTPPCFFPLRMFTKAEFVAAHGQTALTTIVGFDPSRFLFIYPRPARVVNSGLHPDKMHVVDLGCGPDATTSVLLDLSDGPGSRDHKLEKLWDSYHEWCEAEGLLAILCDLS